MSALELLPQEFGADVEVREARPEDHLDGVAPQVVASPRTETAAAELIRYCSSNKLPIIPRGSGTKWHVGTPPQGFHLLLSTKHLDSVYDHDEGNATVTAGAGITLSALSSKIDERRQFFPVDDSGSATLGGVVATNFSNAWRQKYGMPRDLVTGLDVLLSDGRHLKTGAKVVKNVSGYDLPKVFTGSHGTLGLITRATVRLRPNDAVSEMCSMGFDSWESLGNAINFVLDGPFEPTMLRALIRPLSKFLYVRFDGGENAVLEQVAKLGTGEDHPYDDLPPASDWLVRAVLPVSRALPWVQFAHDAGAHEIHWDAGVGVARAAFYATVPPQSVLALRSKAESSGGYAVLERVPLEAKTTEVVWGKPRSDAELMHQVKSSYDPVNIFSPGRFWAGI